MVFGTGRQQAGKSLSAVSMPVLRWHLHLTTQATICKLGNSEGYKYAVLMTFSYLYGGRGTRERYFDDIHVLSLPSFTWTKLYEGNGTRFARSCHRVGSKMMLTVGGAKSFEFQQGPCDTQRKGVNIFDMSSATWGSVYNATAGPYTVPELVVANIGGS